MKPLLLSLLLLFPFSAQAKVWLPSFFTDGMVLQRDQPITLWGTAEAGERVEVVFRKRRYEVKADNKGQWRVQLPAQKAGGPCTLTIGDRTIGDVLVGDVWLCSGQSNVDVPISRVGELYRSEVCTDSLPLVRLLRVERATDVDAPRGDCRTSGWHHLAPAFAQGFSALSYFLAKQMYERTHVPQGVIACSWGGTPIQSWMHADSTRWLAARQEQLLLARDRDYVARCCSLEQVHNRRWDALLHSSDPGRAARWEQSADESQWRRVDVRTDRWAEAGAGSWWLRQHVWVDKEHAAQPCLLRMGTLVDADSTYVNGTFVGTTGYQYPPRRYRVPMGVLREGDNVVTVRITTGGQQPRFVFPKPYCLEFSPVAEFSEISDNHKILLSDEWLLRRGAQLQPRTDYGLPMQDIASACYNAMLAPLAPYALRGVVWYQGESNVDEPHRYSRLLVSLMQGWRSLWQRADLPFYVVQLPDFMDSGSQPEESGWVSLREAQRRATAATPCATLVTGLGLGERHDIHPLRKKEMAARIVSEALGEGAPQPTLAPFHPSEGMAISFDKPLREGTVHGLELSADGRRFCNAEGVAKGNMLTVTCAEAPCPIAVRYAWHNSPDDADLCGTDGQPVCTFQLDRADDGHRAWLKHGAPTGWMQRKPAFERRILNHWDNLNGSIERGYAGRSIFWEEGRNNAQSVTERDRRLWREYGELCQSVGINGAVLNNVNAKPAMLSDSVLARTKEIADVLRPYGITTYLSINFASPKALGGLPTSDPLDEDVQRWWRGKVAEIYRLIPDFGGFLVKANSEGEPGPMDYGRTHAEGANMLADALRPYKGIVMWRAFVYSAGDADRAKQAYAEFMPLDGRFADNVVIQVKNGPIDFQPCEPYSPLFTAMQQTRVMPELQITMEYLGQERWLTFLAPQWSRFFGEVKTATASAGTETCIAAVANIGDDRDWCGSLFNQANLYAFARLAWNPQEDPRRIAADWQQGTFGGELVTDMMLASWHNTVDAMMPLGLHHLFAGEHHYGPEPWYAPRGCRPDWTPPYYHKADAEGIGFDRTQRTGTAATAQYPAPFAQRVEDAATCPEDYLLWFHHLPWGYRMPSGLTLWEELCARYDRGLKAIRAYQDTWLSAAGAVAPDLHAAVLSRLCQQLHDATVWHDACILYFQSINHLPIPSTVEPMQNNLGELILQTERDRGLRWKDSPRK